MGIVTTVDFDWNNPFDLGATALSGDSYGQGYRFNPTGWQAAARPTQVDVLLTLSDTLTVRAELYAYGVGGELLATSGDLSLGAGGHTINLTPVFTDADIAVLVIYTGDVTGVAVVNDIIVTMVAAQFWFGFQRSYEVP